MVTDERYYDSHLHTQSMLRRSPELVERLGAALADGRLAGGVDVGIDPGDWEERLPLLRRIGVAWYSAGIYPSWAARPDLPAALERLDAHAGAALARPGPGPRLVAIGEIGIDCYRDHAPAAVQSALFEAQIEIANRHGLPIIVHNREASPAILAALARTRPAAGGVMHCFSADWDCARALLDAGFYLSFAGNLGYPGADRLREVARRAPIDRLLCETDSPYLSPQGLRGQPNWPYNVRLVYQCLAELRGLPPSELCPVVEASFFAAFKAAPNPAAPA